MADTETDNRIIQEMWLANLAKGLPCRLTIRSGSMTPLLRPGEGLRIVQQPGRVFPGDLVVFREDTRLICHRIMLPTGRARFLQKGDLNPAWGKLDGRSIIGRPEALYSADRTIPLWGWRFRAWNGLVWLLVGLRDLVRLISCKLGRRGGLGESLLSRLIAAIVGRIRNREENRAGSLV